MGGGGRIAGKQHLLQRLPGRVLAQHRITGPAAFVLHSQLGIDREDGLANVVQQGCDLGILVLQRGGALAHQLLQLALSGLFGLEELCVANGHPDMRGQSFEQLQIRVGKAPNLVRALDTDYPDRLARSQDGYAQKTGRPARLYGPSCGGCRAITGRARSQQERLSITQHLRDQAVPVGSAVVGRHSVPVDVVELHALGRLVEQGHAHDIGLDQAANRCTHLFKEPIERQLCRDGRADFIEGGEFCIEGLGPLGFIFRAAQRLDQIVGGQPGRSTDDGQDQKSIQPRHGVSRYIQGLIPALLLTHHHARDEDGHKAQQ